jgi:hypothetical protein
MSNIAAIPPIPSETARTAKAVFGGGNFYILVGEQMDRMLGETGLQHLSEIGKSLQTPAAVLPVVTFFQFIEGLTDEQVADAFRVRWIGNSRCTCLSMCRFSQNLRSASSAIK